MWTAGVDEAGRGPVLGPLVVGSVALPTEDLHLLAENGIRDSKDLNHTKRKAMAAWFHQQASQRGWLHQLVVCPPPRIDAAVSKNGLNLLEVELFAEALNPFRTQLGDGVHILNDACDVNADWFTDRIAARLVEWPWTDSTIHSEHKADSNHAVVGMASILAKVKRDECIAQLAELLGFGIGSGYPSDPYTKAALPSLLKGKTPHPELRWSWKTVHRAWFALHQEEPPLRTWVSDAQQTLFEV